MDHQTIKGEKVPSLALGYRHIDTAQVYGNEAEVGRGIQNSGLDREEIFLVTKVWPSDFSRERVIGTTRESLKKLRTERVDLLLMHWPSEGVPLEETLGAMTELQEEGSVGHLGVSNFPPRMVEEAQRHAAVLCNQVEYHPYKAQDQLL